MKVSVKHKSWLEERKAGNEKCCCLITTAILLLIPGHPVLYVVVRAEIQHSWHKTPSEIVLLYCLSSPKQTHALLTGSRRM